MRCRILADVHGRDIKRGEHYFLPWIAGLLIHGVCKSGKCSCFAGFVGESCGNVALCPSDLSSCQASSCDPLCFLDQASVIAVSVYGDDTEGTGERLNTSPVGKSPKAIRTLRRALEIVQPGQVIALYPGTFTGSANCGLQVNQANMTIRGIMGSGITRIDCSGLYGGIAVSSGELHLSNLTLTNMTSSSSQSGGAINVADGVVRGLDLHITGGVSTVSGGGIAAVRSSLILRDSSVSNCTADKGGAVFLDYSSFLLKNSRVSQSFAKYGAGIYAQNQVFIRGEGLSFIELNNASIIGGGVCVSGTTEIAGVVVEDNTAVTGAGVAVTAASTVVVNSSIGFNSATKNGGGVALLNLPELEMVSSTIQSNIAALRGGGLHVSSNGSVQFDAASSIVNCSAGKCLREQVDGETHCFLVLLERQTEPRCLR